MNATTVDTPADLFLEIVGKAEELSYPCKMKVSTDMEKYDRPYFERIDSPIVVSLSSYGSTSLVSPARFRNDPYLAKSWAKSMGDGYFFFVWQDGAWLMASAEETSAYLYKHAKDMHFADIAPFNNASGYLISFEELVGSIPEHMREAVEQKVFNEHTGQMEQPVKARLREIYEQERDTIIRYLRADMSRVQVHDKDNPEHSEWVDRPISRIGFQFNRFEQVPDGSRQTTAFFSVSDMSPDFKPDVAWNWHLQDTSRWMYAGAIALDYSRSDGIEIVRVSGHH